MLAMASRHRCGGHGRGAWNLRHKRRVSLAALLFVLLVGIASGQTADINAGVVIVTVDDSTALQDLDDFYLGLNIDVGSVYNGLNFTDELLVQLASNLAPAQVTSR